MTEKPEHAVATGCGRQLRRTREKLGLSLDDIASELRLTGFQIQALEEDDWDQLPGATYARGYLRSYARLLGLDAEQLMAGASTQEIEITRKEPEIEARGRGARNGDEDAVRPGPSAGFPWVWASTVVVVAALAAGYWQYRDGGALLSNLAGRQSDRSAVVQSEPRESGAEATRAFVANDDMETSAAPQMPTEPRKAVFQFNERSWTDVRDASGERLLYRSFPRGRRIQIEGQPPFHVFLGNARAVQVEYMGDIVTLDTASGRLYARFVLGAPPG